MIDKISIDRLLKLHPELRGEAIMIYCDIQRVLTGRAICRITYALRTFAEQDALYAQGRTKPGPKVTNARGGQSYHNYGLALDFCLLYDSTGTGKYDKALWDISGDYDRDKVADWMEVIGVFKKYNWESGGEWATLKDWPHVQKVFSLSWQTLQARYKAGRVDKEGYVLL